MDFRTVPAGRGLAWFQSSLRMLDKNPRGLLAITLLFVLLDQLPNLFHAIPSVSSITSVLVLLSFPALWGGMLHAIGEANAGRTVSPMQLFEGLRRPGARAQLLLLGVLVLGAMLLVALAFQRILGTANIAILMKLAQQEVPPDSDEVQQMLTPLVHAVMAAAVILFVLLSGLFFAVPRVMFDGRGAFGAFAESIRACAANVLSLTVYGLVYAFAGFVVFVALLIAGAVLGLLGTVGMLLFFATAIAAWVLLLLVNGAGNYLAWEEVFAHVDAGPPTVDGIAA
jgi:hypothetical protein